ncbi:hypothetical protein FUAX_47780 (plasmid) [Fulvitalea axinellae]|uniref:Uncharacterized protein n=1 Tax=Fulvitalea axinellae TaxID=1182444 RepID=A0AAU9CTD5_9BACT|nr:hypothetical protein FUAX_47780 [Fulvitalea axinellae]
MKNVSLLIIGFLVGLTTSYGQIFTKNQAPKEKYEQFINTFLNDDTKPNVFVFSHHPDGIRYVMNIEGKRRKFRLSNIAKIEAAIRSMKNASEKSDVKLYITGTFTKLALCQSEGKTKRFYYFELGPDLLEAITYDVYPANAQTDIRLPVNKVVKTIEAVAFPDDKKEIVIRSNAKRWDTPEPKIIINGKGVKKVVMEKIDPEDIKTVSVIKGKKGKQSQIIITLKEGVEIPKADDPI